MTELVCQYLNGDLFMELRDFVEKGAEKAGSLTALGKLLDLSQPNMSAVKAHKRGFPIDIAVKLADYIEADLKAVIAANELVTERKEEKRQFWMPFVSNKRSAAILNSAKMETAHTKGAVRRLEARAGVEPTYTDLQSGA